MTANQIILNSLKTLNVPIQKLVYTGTSSTYITYFFYNERGILNADDEEQATRFSLQVDVWGKGDIENLTEQVKTTLQAIGCSRIGFFEDFEKDTKIYHKAYRFYFDQNLNEN